MPIPTSEPGRPTISGEAAGLAEACLAFEDAWREGERPRIEEFLERTRPFDRTTLLPHLIRIEVRQRLRLGETPRPEEYLERFPSDRDRISGIDWDSLTPQGLAGAEADFAASTIVAAPARRAAVGRFELIKRLGAGGFGEVWRAFDPHLQREVAVKIGHFDASDEAQKTLLLHEARSAGRLRHPRIVPVHEAGIEGDVAYIVSDYIPGTTLDGELKAGPLAFRKAAGIVANLAEAAAHAHDRGVVHRDIKPANVLLDLSGEPHLTDFGVARRAAGDKTISQAGQALGTPAYMSPEQAAGDTAAVDPRTDVYALGLVLYELLAGRRAYPGDARHALRAVLTGPPPPLRSLRRDVPADLATIVDVATARERSDRYQSAAALAEDLGRFLNGEPIRGHRIGIVGRAWRWAKRKPAAAAASAVAAATVVALPWLPRLSGRDSSAAETSSPRIPAVATDSIRDAGIALSDVTARRRVLVDTIPSGATVRLFPMDPWTGWVSAEKGIHPVERTPVEVDLSPGEYFVVAELDDGRFNETTRWVPYRDEDGPLHQYDNLMWEADKADPEAPVVLKAIPIPESPDRDGLVPLPGAVYMTAPDPEVGRAVTELMIPPFSMAITELSVGDLSRVAGPDEDIFIGQPAADRAALLSYDEAVTVLERLGIRMATEMEWEYAARLTPPDWEAIAEHEVRVDDFGPVGTPAADRSGPGILGLRSGAPEWTMSWGQRPWGDAGGHDADPQAGRPFGVGSPAALFGRGDPREHRVVRGGDDAVQFGKIGENGASGSYDPSLRFLVDRFDQVRKIGVRGVRSSKPHATDHDFVRETLREG